MSLTQRINELCEELDRAIDAHDMLQIRLTSIELRELERQALLEMDITIARCFMGSRQVLSQSLN